MGSEHNVSGAWPTAESVAALVVVDEVLVRSASQVKVAYQDVACTVLPLVPDPTVPTSPPSA